jgi:hypothetical protein
MNRHRVVNVKTGCLLRGAAVLRDVSRQYLLLSASSGLAADTIGIIEVIIGAALCYLNEPA